MTYGQAMKKVLALLDENKPDAATKEKIRGYLSDGQREVALAYPIWKSATYAASDIKTLPTDCYKPAWVMVDGQRFAYHPDEALPDAFTLEYEAYPTDVPDNAVDEFVFDTSEEAMPAVIYFAAAMVNSMEDDRQPFNTFFALYQGKLRNLTPKKPVGTVVIKCTSL